MVSNFDAQFTKQQIDFLKKKEDKEKQKTNEQGENNQDSQMPELQSRKLTHDHDSRK